MELKEGEVICPECNGTGGEGSWWCMHCHGTGKLDWVESIVGKKIIPIWGQQTLKTLPNETLDNRLDKTTAIQIILYVEQVMKDLNGDKNE